MDGASRAKRAGSPLVRMLAEELERGAILACGLGGQVYRDLSGHSGSIGAHIRHNLEMVECLLKGITDGKIDYSDRERDPEIETDPYAAAARTQSLIEQLASVEGREMETVQVRSEVMPEAAHGSTVGRELEFLHSHTVHHHALINERLLEIGISTDEGFGVAPSTLRFWSERTANAGG